MTLTSHRLGGYATYGYDPKVRSKKKHLTLEQEYIDVTHCPQWIISNYSVYGKRPYCKPGTVINWKSRTQSPGKTITVDPRLIDPPLVQEVLDINAQCQGNCPTEKCCLTIGKWQFLKKYWRITCTLKRQYHAFEPTLTEVLYLFKKSILTIKNLY